MLEQFIRLDLLDVLLRITSVMASLEELILNLKTTKKRKEQQNPEETVTGTTAVDKDTRKRQTHPEQLHGKRVR